MDYSILHGSLDELFSGPQSRSRAQRRVIVDLAVEQLRERYEDRLLAVALYGSTARDEDGPYSDVELWAVIEDRAAEDVSAEDDTFEWIHGRGKTEINVMARSAVEAFARSVEEDWAVTHGQFVHARVLWSAEGHEGLVERLRALAAQPSDEAVDRALAEAVVGNLYELVGKLRNLRGRMPLSVLAAMVAREVACMVGLAERHVFESASSMLKEAARLPAPDGSAQLFEMVQGGDLTDLGAVTAAIERVWSGIEEWAASLGLNEALAQRCRGF